MEWERKARKALVCPELVYILWLATMDRPPLAKMLCYIHILIKIFVVACCILSIKS